MQFDIDDYRVTIKDSKSDTIIDALFGHHPGNKFAVISLPDELMHPAIIPFVKFKVKMMIDFTERKSKMNSTSRYIPNRDRPTKWVVRKFKSEFEKVHGHDIEVAKTNWDYNKAPKHNNTGRFGDLKAFCGMRKGQELDLVAKGE
ncbi:hypothetical protein KASHIRA_02610 [Serratia phage vB_SmaM-Kashira]|nr:hypothetical protein KASHIRA_02610 [Serratia phage vB_SmaM-Kashira]